MQHEVVVRNNVSGQGYTMYVELSPEQAGAVNKIGEELAAESDWDITMVAHPVDGVSVVA